jgi:hypothetical protein
LPGAAASVTRKDERRVAHRKTLHDVMEIAAKFFQHTLASRGPRRVAMVAKWDFSGDAHYSL